MREIKFRAWDKRQNRFILVVEPEEQGKREWYPFEVQIGFSIWDKKDIVLLQYTGLLDRNGKEIYEGDLIIFDNTVGNDVKRNNPYQVIYKEGCFGVREGLEFYPLYKYEEFHIKSIGNIYENPDLFKIKAPQPQQEASWEKEFEEQLSGIQEKNIFGKKTKCRLEWVEETMAEPYTLSPLNDIKSFIRSLLEREREGIAERIKKALPTHNPKYLHRNEVKKVIDEVISLSPQSK